MITQSELQQLNNLANAALERPLLQHERKSIGDLSKKAIAMVIGQSKRIRELKEPEKSDQPNEFLGMLETIFGFRK